MSEYENNDYNPDEEQPILTPEEIEFIKQRRRKISEQTENRRDIFFTDFEPDKPIGEKKTFHVNIPTQELYDTNEDNSFYSTPYQQNDISFNQSRPRERYDHEAYLAEMQAEHNPEIPEEPKKKKSKKRRRRGCSSKFISLLLVVAILLGGCYGYIFLLATKVQHADLKNSYSSSLTRSSGVKNILLLGLDKENGGVSRSDTMMLMSIDTKNKTLKLTSFLRDMWVSIPGYYNAKLNASYAYGGPQLTVDTIESNFGIGIDHFVLVDFEMFEKIIDSLGGVTVDITENEARFLRNNTRVKVPAGENTLNGEYALIYSRIRKLDSDFYRTQRQRKVISAIIDKAKHTNPITLAMTVSEIMPLIETDINPAEMAYLVMLGIRYIQYDMSELQVPADNTYSSQMISGQSALVPNMEVNKNNIHNFIYNTGD